MGDLRQLERCQRTDDLLEQMVGQLGIAGQAATVQVGGDDAALHRAVEPVTGPVARSLRHRGQRPGGRAQNRSAAVVFETGQRLGQTVDQRPRRDLADGALRLRRRGQVQHADPVDPLACRGLIPVTQHLDRRADRQHRRAPRNRLLQTGIADQVLGRQPLRVVLGSAEGVEIQLGGHRIVERDLDDLGGDTPQPQPLSQHHGVAAVTVGAHHVGQHQPDPHR